MDNETTPETTVDPTPETKSPTPDITKLTPETTVNLSVDLSVEMIQGAQRTANKLTRARDNYLQDPHGRTSTHTKLCTLQEYLEAAIQTQQFLEHNHTQHEPLTQVIESVRALGVAPNTSNCEC